MKSRVMVLKLLNTFEEHGFTVYASLDQKSSGEDANETDSWHMSRPVGWTKGAPVYHP